MRGGDEGGGSGIGGGGKGGGGDEGGSGLGGGGPGGDNMFLIAQHRLQHPLERPSTNRHVAYSSRGALGTALRPRTASTALWASVTRHRRIQAK